ncbi:MAG TPA: hypothetical protein VES89_01485 [Candidatus Competibacteraceae bacterium]|nr:hypothetical protein [Candidatus Competibacteraceae bacterium]
MQLSAQDTERFYGIWWPLLRYVNAQRHIVHELPAVPEKSSLSSQDAHQIRQVLWESDELREAFIAENPADLSAADLAIVASWSDRVEGEFFIFRHLKQYTVFLTQEEPPQAYGVLGLVSPIQEVIPWPLPVLVKAVLLPFEDKIIYDSLLVPYSVTFGSGIRRSLDQAYRMVQERHGVMTTLQPRHTEETQQLIRRGNQKILAAFRKDLAASGLSVNMIEHHASTIETFNESYLLVQEPPCSLLDVDSEDLQKYLDKQGKSTDLVSFKRLVRFLLNTGRIDWDVATDMQSCLKQRQLGKASRSRRS